MTLREIAQEYAARIRDPRIAQMFTQCFLSTFETTVQMDPDGSAFVITGDIPAMWLRDSSAQVNHYIPYANRCPEAYDLILGLIRRQADCIAVDPYANAYNKEPSGACWAKDRTDDNPLDWERKYEIDSLCYPIRLAYRFWKQAGATEQFTPQFRAMLEQILDLWTLEQHHENSPYYFERDNCPASDTLTHEGRGTPVGYTGMTWSGFRPSDDACAYGYLVPSNLFAALVLDYTQEIAREIYKDSALEAKAAVLQAQIQRGLQGFAIVSHPVHGTMLAYEVDGLGNANLMDDANVPSLLSLPYLGCLSADSELYKHTRAFVLSPENPHYHAGTVAKGISSPHTPGNFVWPIALCMQGLTSTDEAEVDSLIQTLVTTDAGTGFMHESFHVDDPANFSRDWFSWANSLFAEFLIHVIDRRGQL